MSSERQPWWLPNPPRRWQAEQRPGLGRIGGHIVFLLSVMPALLLIGLLANGASLLIGTLLRRDGAESSWSFQHLLHRAR